MGWSEVKDIILSSVDSNASLIGKTVTGGRLNAAKALKKVQNWLKVDPLSGIVTPGASANLTVTFDAASMNGGNYRSLIVINNNDPFHSVEVVPANLQVTGVPLIAVDPDTVDMELCSLETAM